MSITTKNDIHSDRGIYKQFAYLQNSDVYPNCSDMNKLYEIGLRGGE